MDEVATLTRQVARPLIWHDLKEPWPKALRGGTCFILRFDSGLVGVTANHVIAAFERARRQATEIISLLRTVRFDLAGALLDRDVELDLATFRVTEEQLVESGAIALDCRQEWPPPKPDHGRELSLAGYPEAFKEALPHDRYEFRALVYIARAEDITEQNIIATYEPTRDRRIVAAPQFPELGANWSGCSGGPVLMHVERNGCHRSFPVGIIAEGPRFAPDGEKREFDQFIFRRIHFLNTEGRIQKASSGWLPGHQY